MANILLSPGEKFEHWHSHESETTLIEGDVVLEIESSPISMKVGKVERVPAYVRHVIVNTGSSEAIVYCGGHDGMIE